MQSWIRSSGESTQPRSGSRGCCAPDDASSSCGPPRAQPRWTPACSSRVPVSHSLLGSLNAANRRPAPHSTNNYPLPWSLKSRSAEPEARDSARPYHPPSPRRGRTARANVTLRHEASGSSPGSAHPRRSRETGNSNKKLKQLSNTFFRPRWSAPPHWEVPNGSIRTAGPIGGNHFEGGGNAYI